jgi:archaemetzincin
MNKKTRNCLWLVAFLASLTSIAFCQEGRREKVLSENKYICLFFIGEKDSMLVRNLPHFLETAFCWDKDRIKVAKVDMDLEFAYDAQRKQYLSSAILEKLRTIKKSECECLLAIVCVDLYVPDLNFVFGEADFQTKVALISTIRLREEFYGFPDNEQLFIERVAKEAVHELGHTYGLPHCSNRKCVMHFSNSLGDTDYKSYLFCEDCKKRIK